VNDKYHCWPRIFDVIIIEMESIKKLIGEGEHQQLDFKFRIEDQRKIARTLVAFANSDGGSLLIGVKDNGKVTGVNPEEEFHMIQGAAELFCNPVLCFESRIWQEEMKLVLEIKIESNTNHIFQAQDDEGNWKFYIRRNDQTLIANKIIQKVWKLEENATKKPSVFGEKELMILKLIKEFNQITLSRLYRISELNKSSIDYSVSLLVYWQMVNMNFKEDGVYYQIAEFDTKIN
jgi:predicted HTH transcriptional regulator